MENNQEECVPGALDKLDVTNDRRVSPLPEPSTSTDWFSNTTLVQREEVKDDMNMDDGPVDTIANSSDVPDDQGGDTESRSVSPASNSSGLGSNNVCKICHCGEEEGSPSLITPCLCSGSLQFVHQECLHRWIKSSDIKRCELCKFTFIMQTKVKPLTEWEKLDMTSMEKRKMCCSLTFHMVAVTCVVWSLYVLIDRTTEEIRSGQLQWPFWTKLVVVAIGFAGGLVFMYIQCKVYIQICKKWKAFNRTIIVQDLPNEIIKKEKTAILEARKPGKEYHLDNTDTVSLLDEVATANQRQRFDSGRDGEDESQSTLRRMSLQDSENNESYTSDISVATISRLLEQMDAADSVGMVAVPTVIFFTQSEANTSKKNKKTTLAEPLLICDLPGQNISLGTQLRDNGVDDCDGDQHGLESLDGRVDGPDLSLHSII